ncbi:hypothetical protein PV05_12064 [Exophiala xenobiotica]|uniref:PRISE-like Rossmann-fold domain-containing protein n=1 Tax=Exophiala xenobiotica TaxID=348802 RepID=A0A0D2ERS4_9EURO|nr:uncharacterized protein PV05_12064 [Exophiala xenobiotica]KIW50479.1 hypothetical protein PV05_12064 [Exophiala xenobiotica]
MAQLSVETQGIYWGIPTYPSTVKGLKALVFGANGISGNYMVRALSRSPERWSQVVALSRRPPSASQRSSENVRHVQADLLQEPKDLAQILKNEHIQADVVFFFAYMQPTPKEGASLWSNAEELCKVNGQLLQNCFQALDLASIRPKRFLLQTGAKYYGGGLALPAIESDPRVPEPNFYYVQEDLLSEYSRRTGVEWNVVRPAFIIGAVEDAAMNSVYPLAVYAAVQKHKGEKLIWPGDVAAWEREVIQSSAWLNSYLSEFLTLHEDAKNQAFNAADACYFTYGRLWLELAGWYGIDYTLPEVGTEGFQEVPMGFKKNLSIAPMPILRFKFSFVQWAERPENKTAWKELMEIHGLRGNPFGESLQRIFEFLDFAVLPPFSLTLSVTKARKLGWNGYVDPILSHREVIEEFAAMKMIPPLN